MHAGFAKECVARGEVIVSRGFAKINNSTGVAGAKVGICFDYYIIIYIGNFKMIVILGRFEPYP